MEVYYENGLSSPRISTAQVIWGAARKACEAKLAQAHGDANYAATHLDIITACSDVSFIARFNSTEHLEALHFDIPTAYIFQITNPFQTRAIGICRKKLEQASSENDFMLHNKDLVEQCNKIEEILKFDRNQNCQALEEFNVPPSYAHQFDNDQQIYALKLNLSYQDAVSLNRLQDYLLYVLKVNKKIIEKSIIKDMPFTRFVQINAFAEGVTLEKSMSFNKDESVQALRELRIKYKEDAKENPQFFDWLMDRALLIESKWALHGLDKGFTVEQAVKTEGIITYSYYSAVNELSDWICGLPLLGYIFATASNICELIIEADKRLFLEETNQVADHL